MTLSLAVSAFRRSRTTICYSRILIGALVLTSPVIPAVGLAAEPERIQIAERVETVRLLDLCSSDLGLLIAYDPGLVRGSVTLRSPNGVPREALLPTVHRLLASQDLALIAGSTESPLLTLVSARDAVSRARLESVTTLAHTPAGFVRVRVELNQQTSESASRIAEPLVTPSIGSVRSLPGQGAVIVADYTDRARSIIAILEQTDDSTNPVATRLLHLRFLSAERALSRVTEFASAKSAVDGIPLRGTVRPATDDQGLWIIAPEAEIPAWESFVAAIDRLQPVETRIYQSVDISLSDLAEAVQSLLTWSNAGVANGAAGTPRERAGISTNTLLGTLSVTATADEHVRIEDLLERLASRPLSARQQQRSYSIRNRPIGEVLNLVESMMDEIVAQSPVARAVPERGEHTVPSGTPPRTTGAAIPPDHSGSRAGDLPRSGSVRLIADEPNNTLLAIGTASQLDQLGELVESLDRRQPQVQLEVLFVSLSESQTRDLGVELQSLVTDSGALIGLSSLFGLSDVAVDAASSLIGSGNGGTGVVLDPGDYSVVVRALETVNGGRSLTTPRVLVTNNQKAVLDSVTEQPFISTNASDTVATTSFGGSSSAGTQLTITPTISEADHVVLEYTVSLSSFVGESADPALPPPRQENSLSSLVSIPDGYTIAVGGIDIETKGEGESRVPILGEIPILGNLFKTTATSRSRSRFFVFIRPTVVRDRGFETLKYLSESTIEEAGIDDGWPIVRPRMIR